MENVESQQSARVAAGLQGFESGQFFTQWVTEMWEEDQVDFAREALRAQGRGFVLEDGHDFFEPAYDTWYDVASGKWRPLSDGLPSDALRKLVGDPDKVVETGANLLLNEGIGRMLDLLVGAGGAVYNNAGAFIGVGDTNTAAAATQTELQATANAANRFYKAMVATYPLRPGSNGAQSVDFRSDFISSEANFVWAEWTVAAGATTASGGGFLVGTTNLNRKVEALGTKATGTWTHTGTVTIA
jgi:hypothetical protein